MKKLVIIILATLLVGGGYYLYTKSQPTSFTTISSKETTAPARPAELNGTVVSIEGNEVVIANEIGRVILSDEEQAAKKAAMQKMSDSERQAAKAQESQQYETTNVTVIVPVGVPITKGTGDGSGNSVLTDLSSLTKGTYVSIWTQSEGIAEYVKIKGI